MWHTPSGVRTLTGAEADLVRATITHTVDMLEIEAKGMAKPWPFNIPLFDNLTWQQRFVLCARVGESLLREEIPPPELTAVNEATVGALYENLRRCVVFEVESDDPDIADGLDTTAWRRLVVAAIEEVDKPEVPQGPDDQLPSPNCRNLDEWETLVETLESFVLWDTDWLDADLFMDVDPDTSRLQKRRLDIADGYYTAIPPDPKDADLKVSRVRLRRLLKT